MNFPIASPIPWLYQTLWQAQDEGGSFAYKATVYKASLCPCGNTPTDPNNINCAACGGYGILYPLSAIEALVLISDITQNLDLVQYGLMEDGDLVVSPAPGNIHFDNFDLLMLPWTIGTPTFSEILVRGSGTTDAATYRVLNITGAWTVNVTTGASTEYVPNRDFTYDGKVITWISGRAQPAAGVQYSIRYDAQFEWVSYNPPEPRVAWGQDLGQKAVFRKRHILLPNAPTELLRG